MRRQPVQALAVLSLLAACAPAPRYTSEPPGGRTVVEELRARQRALRNSSPRRLLEVANGYLGIPYKWGGTTRTGMDCSAMARAIVREAAQQDYRISAFIRGVIESDAFQMSGPEPAVAESQGN